jgi:hypothetical protein
MNLKINLPNDKHIGLIFDPRSGSHIFRNYISELLNILDLNEFLNPLVHPIKVSVDKIEKKVFYSIDHKSGKKFNFETFNEITINKWANDRIDVINDMTEIGLFSMFGILLKNTLSSYPDIVKKIKQRPDIYFIRLKRADVLYSILSIEISRYTTIWHNIDNVNVHSRKQIKDKIEIPIDVINNHLKMYTDCEDLIKKIFDEMPIIYYEQWQNNIHNLNKILKIPNKIISIDFQKFEGNYKDLISNIDEIENHYAEFVNDHPKYFPQYFGKLPEIKIPESQGWQPNQ